MSSTVNQRKTKYLETEEGISAKVQLEQMARSPLYNTRSSYSPSSDGLTFVDKHLAYLCQHNYLHADEYIGNLKLMTKQRV